MGALDLIKTGVGAAQAGFAAADPEFAYSQYLRKRTKKDPGQEIKDAIARIKAAGGKDTAAGRKMLSELTGRFRPEDFLKTTEPKTRTPEQIARDQATMTKALERAEGDEALTQLYEDRLGELDKEAADVQGKKFVDVPGEKQYRFKTKGWLSDILKKDIPATQAVVPKALGKIMPGGESLAAKAPEVYQKVTAETGVQPPVGKYPPKQYGVTPEQAPSVTDQPKTIDQQTNETRLKKIIAAYKRTPAGRASTLQAVVIAKTHPNTVEALTGMKLADIREVLWGIEQGYTDEQIMAAVKESTK